MLFKVSTVLALGCFYERAFGNVGNRLFLDLCVGYVSVFSLWKF